MTRMIRLAFLMMLFMFALGSPVFAQTPKILKLSEVKFDTKAVGFSVFRGVEPEKFDVQLREVHNTGGFLMILSRISGGPMETPLEKIGAIAAMSGSPIFVGNCQSIEECARKVVLPDNDVFLVGALSHALGYFTEGGPNAGLTSSEYMLGTRFGGYMAIGQFSTRPPNKITVDGREFKNLMLFSGVDGSQMQGAMPNSSCGESVQSDIKPGSMVTVFIAKGSRDVGSSGTVFWRDGDIIYIFGHSFFGTGAVSYPFSHVSVADTLQTPYQAHKIIGCRLETEGAIFMDGAYEMGGVIGWVAKTLPYKVELHLGDNLVVFDEEVAESPWTPAIINRLPIMWAEQMFGNMRNVSVIYQSRIRVTDQPEIFLNSLIPTQGKEYPFVEALTRISATLKKLAENGSDYNLESITVHVDFTKDVSVWTAKRSFLSQKTAKPGETVYVNVALEERSSGAVRQVSIPVKVPDDFKDRLTSKTPPQFSVVVQSADKFVDKSAPKEISSLSDVIRIINESTTRQQNVLYVQQIMPLTKAEHEATEESAKSLVQPAWSWIEMDQGAMRRLPGDSDQEVTLAMTPELGRFISFDATFTILVNSSDTASDESVEKNKRRRWYLLYLF